MLLTCAGGLFVGVEGYNGLSKSRILPGATLDANKLADFFSRSAPTNHWKCLVEHASGRPSRSRILLDFDEMVRRVPSQKCGIFYFSGHGVGTHNGLVLTTTDFKASLAYDTGIPLRRLFDIVKEKSKIEARFLMILDCCRFGVSRKYIEDVPQNVCLIHGCSPGGQTIESSRGGVFTEAFLNALQSLARRTSDEGGAGSCNTMAALNRTCEFLPYDRYPNLCEPEIAGFRPELIELPVISESDEGEALKLLPHSHLTASRTNEAGLARLHTNVDQQLRLWLDIPPDAPLGVPLLCEEETWTLKVGLLSRGHLRATLLLERLLNTFPDAFETLTVTWPIRHPPTFFNALHLPEDGERIEPPDGELGFRWPNSSIRNAPRGEAWVWNGPEKTYLEIRCVSREGPSLPLVYLLPSLLSFFDRTRRLHYILQ